MKIVSPLEAYAADHRALLARAAEVAGLTDPVAVDLDYLSYTLLKHSRKGAMYPVDGVMVRDWGSYGRSYSPHLPIGIRLYEVEGVRFAVVGFGQGHFHNNAGYEFTAVDRKDYRRLYRFALRLYNRQAEASEPPVLDDGVFQRLRRNTIEYLEPANLKRIRELGGRPKRGVLLSGPPGNGKTSACRWLWAECIRLSMEYRTVSADAYAEARKSCGAEENVRALFTLDGTGVIVFDDFDLALRDRDATPDSDDQSVFLNALDGVRPTEGIVYVFTTNCPLDRIDRAFRRPGRIDVVLTLDKPDAGLRERLVGRWHPEVRAGIDVAHAVASTDGYSFAELDEVKNQLILAYLDNGAWSWDHALEAFAANRRDVRPVGSFGFAAGNGCR
jgi:cell division protease FtsH